MELENKQKLLIKISLVIGLFLVGCNIKPKLQPYHDPYLESFYDKNLKQMVSYDPDDPLISDTISFDSVGNIISVKQFGNRERRTYDSLHFLRHVVIINDVPSDYLIEYSMNEKSQLIQQWSNVHLFERNLPKVTTKNDTWSVIFEIDNKGRVIQETDTAHNELVLFVYDKDQKLCSKDIYDFGKRTLLRKWQYYYDDEAQLSRIELGYDSVRLLTHYYSNSTHLLDSTIDHVKGYMTNYKYFYY